VRKIVLATGYYDVANQLNVPGEEMDKVLHYSQRAAPVLQPRRGGDRRQELGGDRGSRTLLDGARVTLIHRGGRSPIR
jgi:thioredoxin reductase (NADPH)